MISDVTGKVISDVTSDVSRDVKGDMPGVVKAEVKTDMTGDVTGDATSDATGDATSDATSDLAGDATSDATGDATSDPTGDPAPGRLLLIVEDDAAFARTLRRSFERRGYAVLQAANLAGVEAVLRERSPGFAIVDLKLDGETSGLACVRLLHGHDAAMQIVVLTGFASIATAVESIKLGACHYLAKPSNSDDIEAAFGRNEGDADVQLTNRPTSIKTLEWERIHEALADADFNISETARRLGMHRRTLARKLEKQRVR